MCEQFADTFLDNIDETLEESNLKTAAVLGLGAVTAAGIIGSAQNMVNNMKASQAELNPAAQSSTATPTTGRSTDQPAPVTVRKLIPEPEANPTDQPAVAEPAKPTVSDQNITHMLRGKTIL